MTRLKRLSGWCLVVVGALILTAAAPAFGACLLGDADCDGVLDAFDLCPTTPALELVNTSGCSICPCDAGWASHSAYVSCVTAEANREYLVHLLTKTQRTAVINHAQKSTCGTTGAIRCCTWRKLVTGSMGSCAAIQSSSCTFAIQGKWAENRGTGSCFYNPCTW